MKALGFTPHRNYLHKRFTQIVLIAFIVVSVTLFLGQWIGHWVNPSQGGTLGLVISLSLNLAWLGLIHYLTYQHFRGLFYEIHEDEVIMHAGVITRSVTHVPFQMITNLKLRRSPLDRLFKLGTIDIQTSGHGEYHGVAERLVGLRNYKEVYDTLAASMRYNHDLVYGHQEKEILDSSEIHLLKILLKEMKTLRILIQNHDMHQKHPG